QDLQHLRHGGAVAGVGVAARQPEQQQPRGLAGVEPVGAEALVHSPEQRAAAVHPPHPVRQHRARRVAEQRVPAGDDLEHEHAEREHVGLARRLVADGVLRRDVAARAGDAEVGEGAAVEVEDAGEAEVAEPRAEGGVEEDVAGLDVAVEHHGAVLVVDVVQAGGDVGDDVAAALPAQRRPLLVDGASPENVLVQAAVGHVLVHQQQLPFLVAPT
ncbi:Os08g0514033, partial [Oryza sativa Japonica Group]